jgi:hypothetical protein
MGVIANEHSWIVKIYDIGNVSIGKIYVFRNLMHKVVLYKV